LFINAGCSIQTLYDFGPQTPNTRYYNFLLLFPTRIVITEDFRGESTAGFINFTSGIYRTHFILSRTDVRETIITLNDLLNANDIILTNSVRGVVKVHKLYYGNEFVEFT